MFGLNLKSGAKEAAVQGAIEGTSIGAQLVEDATGVPVATLLEAGMTMKDLMDAANDKKTVTNPYRRAPRLGENGESTRHDPSLAGFKLRPVRDPRPAGTPHGWHRLPGP